MGVRQAAALRAPGGVGALSSYTFIRLFVRDKITERQMIRVGYTCWNLNLRGPLPCFAPCRVIMSGYNKILHRRQEFILIANNLMLRTG